MPDEEAKEGQEQARQRYGGKVHQIEGRASPQALRLGETRAHPGQQGSQ